MKSILIVDDEPLVREIIREALPMDQFRVFEASNGKEAFQIVSNHNIECVVSDIRMPGGNGIELVQNINAMVGNRPKIILMTGYSDFTWKQAEKLSVAKILGKPFEPEEVLKEILRVFDVQESK